MPNRILREGILTSPRIAKLGWAEEVFYRRLMSVVDDFGRYYADPGLLHAACYPRQLNKVSDSDIGKWLSVCETAALVRVYPASDGERYVQVLDFGQQVRAKKSKFPDPLSVCAADAKQLPADAHLDVSVFVSVSEDEKPRKRVGPPEGVPVLLWDDFLKTRKAKLTDTALRGIEREAKKAGMPIADVLTMCCERGWRSFKADWLGDKKQPSGPVRDDAEATRRMLEDKAQGAKPPSLETLQKLAQLRKAA